MDAGHQFLLAVIAALLTWVLSKIFENNIGAWITSIGAMFVLLPIFFVLLIGVFAMESVSSNTTAMNNIANDTNTRLVNYIVDNLPSMAISQAAGILIGRIMALF